MQKKVPTRRKLVLLEKDSQYYRRRHLLFSKNFVLSEIIKKIKPVLEKNIGKNNIQKFVDYPNLPEFNRSFSLVREVASWFEIDYHFLTSLTLLNKGLLSYFSNLEIITAINTPVYRKGVYVRFHPQMNLSDWVHEYKKAKKEAQSMPELYPDTDKDSLSRVRVKNQAGYLDSKRNFSLYIEIESKIAKYVKTRGKNKDYVAEAYEDISHSGISIMDSIFEQLVAKTGIQDDKELNKLKKSYKAAYYAFAIRYRLPNFRDLSKYLTLLDEFVR